jgi:peptidase M28-like protein/PDZ domain-containing protein
MRRSSRATNYPGNDKASEYIAAEMKRCGLKPVGDKDAAGNATFFQSFRVGGRATRNCIGLIEGTDPDLAKELVVVGAHHDHVGTEEQGHFGRLGKGRGDREDEIYNGADDNGSGTTTVLGIIRAFGEGGLRAKRSILFMTFSGEEWGLLGSKYYVENPIRPIAQHVFMLNLDMVGRNEEKPVSIDGVGSDSSGTARKAAEAAVAKTGLNAKINDRVMMLGGDSDHSSFRDKGVPFAFFFTGLHADYHKTSDHADRLAYGNMAKIGQTSVHMLLAIANGDGPRPPDPGPRIDDRKLGFTPGDDLRAAEYGALGLDEGQGAMKVTGVTAGTVAENAGMQTGDHILSVGGSKLRPGREREDLRAAIRKAPAGKDVPIVVLRGGRQVTLQAKWEK